MYIYIPPAVDTKLSYKCIEAVIVGVDLGAEVFADFIRVAVRSARELVLQTRVELAASPGG